MTKTAVCTRAKETERHDCLAGRPHSEPGIQQEQGDPVLEGKDERYALITPLFNLDSMLLDLQAQVNSLQISRDQLYQVNREKTRALESSQAKYLSLKTRAMAGDLKSAAVSDDSYHASRASTTHIFPEHMSRSHSRAPSAMNRWSGTQGVIPGMPKPPSTPIRLAQQDGLRPGAAMGPPAQPPRST
jgi:hypothetical protein